MFYLTHTPGYPLSRFIKSFWYGEHSPQHTYERLLPNGDIDIVLNLRDARLQFYDDANLARLRVFTGPVASGVHSRYYVIDTLQQASLLGVRFRPGGAYPFLGDAADQLQDRHVALEDLWGRVAIGLQSRLMEAETHEARFHCLERALLSQLADTIRPHPEIAKAACGFVAQHGTSSVTAAAVRSGLSPRRFIELFRREVGLPPKAFCRLLRFQRALRLLARSPRPNLARLAVECGFYDQAHLIRDFRAFAGITPTAYLARRGVHYNHVPLGGEGQIRPIPAPAGRAE
jgi:AraC-like DNA-binding protein